MALPRRFLGDDRAEVSQSAMLLFVASLVIGGLTFGTLLSQVSLFGDQGAATARETARNDAVGVAISSAVGTRPASPGALDGLNVYLAVHSEGPPLDLARTVAFLNVDGSSGTFVYDEAVTTPTTYTAEAVRDVDGSFSGATPILTDGDTVRLTFDLDAALQISPEERLVLRLEPEVGHPLEVDLLAPATFGSGLAVQLL